jgi:hypothetical protein
MEEQASGLAQAIAVFRIDGGAEVAVRRTERSPATGTGSPAPVAPVAPVAPRRRAAVPRVLGNTALDSTSDWAEF